MLYIIYISKKLLIHQLYVNFFLVFYYCFNKLFKLYIFLKHSFTIIFCIFFISSYNLNKKQYALDKHNVT